MKKNLRLAVLSVLLLTALTLNGAFPQSALADEVPPPAPETSEPAPTDPEPTEPPPAEEPTPVAPEDGTTQATAPSEVLTDIPAQTELVVLDENGQPVALTTTEAALIIATGDPMWCPAGVLPGGVGCTAQFAQFDGAGGLLDELQNDPALYSGPGTIFIAFDYTTALDGSITIDGNDGYGLEELTIQGGWDFGLNQYSGAPTTIEDALEILNWDYDVTLNDLLFDGASLTVETSGDIELNDVEVRDNGVGYGATLDNTAGAKSTIEVNSSSFHDNFTIGIQALSNGGIALTDVDAYDNGGRGAVLDNSGSAFAGTVTIETSTFNDNGDTGLDVSSNGAILATDIEASGNAGYGAVLDNSLSDDPHSVTVDYEYGNEFYNNDDAGLTVLSQGDITVHQVTATFNGSTSGFAGAGAYLDNTYGDGDTYVYNYDSDTDLYGEFSHNYADGLDVYSNGNVELWYVIAEDNGNTGNATAWWGMGTYIDNCSWDGLSCDGTGWVEVNESEFNDNYSTGLDVYSAGAIELNGGTADDNGLTGLTDPVYGMGAYLDNSDGSGGVTITDGDFGSFSTGGNYSDGLNVYSTGNIYLSYVYAEDNGNSGNSDDTYGNGAVLDSCLVNAGECAGSGYVYVFHSEFNDNYADGLQAFASENIWLNYYVSANDNGQSLSTGNGALLVNNFDGATGSILLYGPITLNNNYNTGLIADSNGDITMSGVEGNFNTDAGATVTTTAGSVTIDDSTFNSNDDYGLGVTADGDIELTDVEANDNATFGAALASATGDVKVEDGSFNDNTADFGLDIAALGDVSLAHVEALANGSYGASISNAGNTTISNGFFSGNLGDFGLFITTGEDVTLTHIAANENATFGAQIANGGSTWITDGSFNENLADFGLSIVTSDNVDLVGVAANANATFGALISNGGSTTIDNGSFSGNLSAYGLTVSTADNVVLDDVVANANDTYGAAISNGGDTTISDSTFNENVSEFGLDISSGGDVSLSDLEANENATYGAQIGNAGNTTVTHGLFNGNLSAFGLDISSGGDVMLTDVEANDNATFGTTVSNGGNVTIQTGSFSGNTADFGLDISSAGNVSLADVEANNNGDFGATISNGGGTSIVNGFFDGNLSMFGLDVSSFSDVFLMNVSASNNNTYGADLTSGFGGVTVKGGTFDDNNGAGGLDVSAFGPIDLGGISASGNATYGADIAGGNDVYVDGTFDWNTGSFGLNVNAGGDVTFGEGSASHNGSDGVVISSGGAVFVGPSLLEWNNGTGLDISGAGNVTLVSVAANHNTSLGTALTTPGSAKIVTSSMGSNGADGLNVFAGGSVQLLEVSASDNPGVGASVVAGGNVTVNGGQYSHNTGDGLSITTGGDAFTRCVSAIGNGGYGLDATLPGVLTTKGADIYDNAAGDVNVGGGGTWEQLFANCEGWPHVDTSGLPWVVLHVTTGDAQPLDCSIYGGTVLILPNWDHVAIPCPIQGDASLTSVASDRLPGELGDNYTYVSGLEVQVKPSLDGEIRIDFLIPPTEFDSNLIILHWDGSQWVDRGGIETKDKFFEITSREGGIYVLVSQ